MSNVVINQTRLHLGSSASSKVDFVASDSYSFERSRSSAAVVQRTATVSKLGDFRTLGYQLSAMSNARQDPVLRDFPSRLFHTSVRATGGLVRTGSSATRSITLNLGHDQPVTWTVGMLVDGAEASGAAPSEYTGIDDAYHESKVQYAFGGTGFLANLTAASQGGSLASAYTVAPTSRRTGTGPLNMNHDVTQQGFTASLSLLLDAESDKLLSNETGFFCIRRTDANYAYVIPMIVTAYPVTGPIATAATIAASFTQAPGVVAMGVPQDDGDFYELTTGSTTYTLAADGITIG